MKCNVHLNFNDQCKEAFEFYARTFGGKVESMMMVRGTPVEAHVPPEALDKVMHATLSFGENVIMGADNMMGEYQRPTGYSVALHVNDPDEADRLYDALSEGGELFMPMQETFWAQSFGMCRDRFGIPWMINCSKA